MPEDFPFDIVEVLNEVMRSVAGKRKSKVIAYQAHS
jgi:hypothetical protein